MIAKGLKKTFNSRRFDPKKLYKNGSITTPNLLRVRSVNTDKILEPNG